jgi:diadenosine tetraphosphatase ApaH/serine/threonine PP2A family protein phosphatase
MRTIFIGDVHGCREELSELLREALLGTPGEDRVVFVGDLVDKGPDSLGVLRDAQRILRTFPGSVVVSGNHEEKALRFKLSGKLDAFMDGHEGRKWVYEATDSDWEFIASMPLTWNDDTLGIRVVHGGLFPVLLQAHPDVFDKIEARGDKWRKGGGKALNRARRMLRVRYVGGDHREEKRRGAMLALGENEPGDPFWAETYNGTQGHIVYGHSPWLSGEVRIDPFAVGIDTAAVFGGKLTALIVGSDKSRSFVSVDAEKRYAEPLEED